MRIPTRTPGCMIAAPLILVALAVGIVAGWLVVDRVFETPTQGHVVEQPIRP